MPAGMGGAPDAPAADEPAADEPAADGAGRAGRAEALTHLDAGELRAALIAYRDALRAHQQRLNRLNVFPVPDGDTGTNMALTLESVVAAMEKAASPEGGMEATCRAVSHGSLMGARGNSGVILSQVLRGMCQQLAAGDRADGAALARALSEASSAAYTAVMRPVEGTILTVVREASEAAVEVAERPLVEVVEAAAGRARDALARTPEMLPTLAEAGVVDAGGAGFVLLVDALLHVVDGRPLPVAPEAGAEAPAVASRNPGAAPSDAGQDGAGIEGPRYEVMYFLEADDDRIEGFKNAWAEIGDSIVVVGGDGVWNCHIHSDDIGASIEAGIEVGRPRQIRVTDLAEQVVEERWVRQAIAGERLPPADVATAVVAVALGEAVKEAFEEMGAQQVVVGGQTMNPSTAELLEAVEATAAGEVVLLPNNSNVVRVAEQAAGMASKPVHVVPTRGIVGGLAAMLAYDAAADGGANRETMAEAAAGVLEGQVTWAVRDTGDIAEGDWLGLAGDEIVVSDPDLATCATGLLDKLIEPGHELVTVLEGQAATGEATASISRWLESEHAGVTVEVQRWKVPLSAYLFSIE